MVKKHRVVLAYLEDVNAGIEIPPHMASKEDKGKQTRAIESMLKDLLNGPLSKYKDTVFAVGGSVRDQLLNRAPKDLDLMIDDPKLKMRAAEQFTKDLARQLGITTGQNPHALKDQYGIWGVVLFSPNEDRTFRTPDGTDVTGYQIEVAPSRKEGPRKGEKREPEWVDYTPREDDAKRRDLTINAIYKNLATGKIEDYVGGVQDLEDKTLRPPEHPEGTRKIYEEDPLRIFRLVRFTGKLGDFKVDPDTEKVAIDYVNSPEGRAEMKEVLSGERIRDELTQILTHKDPQTAVRGMEMLRKWNLLEFVAPEFDKLIDIMHDTVYHQGESVWQHTMDVLGRTQNNSLKARLGALFHDIGKVSTAEEAVDKEGRPRVHFKGHEDVGPEIVQKALRELHFPSDVIGSVSKIVHGHMSF
ncbi:MAG: HDIG domain-containing protein, partial [Candidatus Altiarchaeales archaeon]|nr:HDIG domain-containing protein [Candidatus Altiarchaeales archaeon]